jgi:hypothetical protein
VEAGVAAEAHPLRAAHGQRVVRLQEGAVPRKHPPQHLLLRPHRGGNADDQSVRQHCSSMDDIGHRIAQHAATAQHATARHGMHGTGRDGTPGHESNGQGSVTLWRAALLGNTMMLPPLTSQAAGQGALHSLTSTERPVRGTAVGTTELVIMGELSTAAGGEMHATSWPHGRSLHPSAAPHLEMD